MVQITDALRRILPQRAGADRRELAKEARHFARVLARKLEQLNICYRFPKNQKDFLDKGISRVGFERVVTTPEALYYRVDSMRLPRGVKLADIADERVLSDLSIATGRPVRYKENVRSGAWLIVERDSAACGIIRKLPFSDILDNWPNSSSKSLSVPLGVGANKKLVFRSLAEMPHALVGGATGSGKTRHLHAWHCALLLQNEPSRLRTAFVDLKGGVEANFYRGIPHLLEGGIVMEAEGVPRLLERLHELIEERLIAFRRSGVENIASWNYRNRSEYMPRVVLFVDEMANIMLDKDIKKDSQKLLADITARGRAPGVHVVLATQRPEVAVVPGLIKANLDARCGFRCTDNASSQVLLDDTSAARFDDSTPPGRYIYKRGLDRSTYQSPLVSTQQIRQIVRAVTRGESSESESARVNPEDVFKRSLEIGSFSIRAMYQALDGAVSQRYLRDLAEEYEGQIIEIDSELYVLEPGNGGNIPRKLMPMRGDDLENGEHITHNT